jgi:hypothetical protein
MKSPRLALEVLAASFALDQDVGVNRPGALVHHLDVGGIPVAEGPGFQTILTGARTLYPDADALLKAMTGVLDGLYAGDMSASQT